MITSRTAHCLFLMDAAASSLPAQARAWYSMKKKDEKTGEVMIYDEIGASFWNEDAVSAKSFDEDLKALGDVENIDLRVNSPGGNVFDGIAIHNMLKNHKAKVTAYVDGIAASAASLVVMAADKIVMPANAFMLIHGASGFAMGMADDFRKMADDLDRINKSATAVYASRSGQKPGKISAIMAEDRLMDAEEAKSLGLCDETTEPVRMAAKFSMRLLPKAAAEKIAALQSSSAAPPPAVDDKGPADNNPPAPTNSETNVVELKTRAKAEGREEHAKYVNEVLEVCTLAGLAHMAAGFIKDNKPMADVRAALMAARASSDDPAINPHLPPRQTQTQLSASKWDKVIEKMTKK